MTKEEIEKYKKAYFDNEASANKKMAFASMLAGAFLLVLTILYAFGLFPVHDSIRIFILISFPFLALVSAGPFIFSKVFKKAVRHDRFKFYVIFQFILIVAMLNIIIPKHTVLGWALIIIMVNHYYNPKFGTKVFITCIIFMLFALYLGALMGEYDPHLLGNGIIVEEDGVAKIAYIDGIVERIQMMNNLLQQGENRYFKIFFYYYIPRSAILGLIFYVSYALNRRTNNLLLNEIQVSNENSKTKTELEVAKEIQINTLPVEFVTNKDIEIQAELKPAKEVGGDFYDYYKLDENNVAILIADVSGKGIPAAMFMMKTITCFKNYMSINKKPSEIMKQVNSVLFDGNNSQMFVTAILVFLNTKTGHVILANAGHNRPLIGKYPNFRFLTCKSGFVLGGLKEAFVYDEEFDLENGEQITLYTDGITEAMNDKREQYGENRFLSIANKREYSCLLEFHHELKDDIERFVNGADQSDDITYITLKYHGDNYLYKEKLYKANKDEIPNMLDFLSSFAKENSFEEKFTKDLLVVGDELLSNVVKYAYNGNPGEIYIRVLYNIDKKEFIFTIIDTGKGFNPFDTDAKPLNAEEYQDRPVGGLGILIVKQMMSEYAYDRVNNKNIVILRKKF